LECPLSAAAKNGHAEISGEWLPNRHRSERDRRSGNDVAMIFQEPMTSLNPVLTIGFQIAEALILHRGLSRSQAPRH
jgi:peptide/nickel transport system ATP-binding protein